MAIRYQHGSRRRRIIVSGTSTAPAAPAAASIASHTIVVPRHPRRSLAPGDYTFVTSTKGLSTSLPSPPPGGGGSPRPLQPTWIIGSQRACYPKPVQRPIILHQKYVQPPNDGFPNQAVIVPPLPRRRAAHPIVVHPTFKWGINNGVTPNPPVVVEHHSRTAKRTVIVVHAPADKGRGFRPPNRAVVPPRHIPVRSRTARRSIVVRPANPLISYGVHPNPAVVAPHRSRKLDHPSILFKSGFDRGTLPTPSLGRTVVVHRNAPRRRLRGLVMILPFDAFELMPPMTVQPIVVPYRRRTLDLRRPVQYGFSKVDFRHDAVPPVKSIVVPFHPIPLASPWTFTSLTKKYVEPPPQHFPLPRPLFVRIPKRHPRNWPKPIMTTSILQPDSQRYDKPWDLIAACIAWLRTKPEIVAAFGDDATSSTSLKFTSDIEPPKTDAPYAVFNEPEEFDGYETIDHTGRPSSLAEGYFQLSVYATEKLLVRKLADMVAASIDDAPLVFTDGVLVYLRRSERKFPTFTSPGTGANVTMFKRLLEFEYKIERYV